MRKIYSLLVITILLVSCGEQKKASVQDLVSNGTIKELRARKAEITEQLANTNVDLKSINDAISKLDDAYGKGILRGHLVKPYRSVEISDMISSN